MPPTSRIDRLSDYLARQAQAAKEALRQTLYSVAISAGGLLVRGGSVRVVTDDGHDLAYFGRASNGVDYWILRNRHGQTMVDLIEAPGAPAQVVSVRDSDGQILFSADWTTGSGIGRPWLPMPLYPTASTAMSATSSGAWGVMLSTGFVPKQHSTWGGRLYVGADDGTSGEYRINIDGTTVAGPFPIGSTFQYVPLGPIPVPGAHGSEHVMELQVRRTAGTGQVYISGMGIGRQA